MNEIPAPRPRLTRLARLLLSALSAWPLGAPAADAVLPAGPKVVHGQASFATAGQALTVTTGRSTAIDWRSFSIGPQASVRFEQPDAASQVLNRVLGRDPSRILGRLSSNGEVWLINPYGVLFGRDARVDVGGLVASSLDLRSADWAAGRRVLSATAGMPAAAVANEGTLRSSTGGRILLVGAGEVVNSGTIDTNSGQAGLLGGTRLDLADSHRPDIAVRLDTLAGTVDNAGRIVADGGRIDLQAAMVNQTGVLRADSLTHGSGGTVRLQAAGALTLAAGSHTSAVGRAAGGQISLVGGTQLVQGRLDAGSSQGAGGQVTLAAPRIALLDGAELNADGARGGGQLRIGLALDASADGGVSEQAAKAVFVSAQAQLSADATAQGDGGHIRLWGGDSARVFGRFSARGGPHGGDGGFIETSAHGLLAEPARVDTRAPQGRAGLWRLDPLDIQIVPPNAGDGGVSAGPDFSPTGPGARVTTTTLVNALAEGDVTISTDVAGPQAGTISMLDTVLNAPLPEVDIASGTIYVERTLTLQANAGIRLDGSVITSATGRLKLRLLAGEGAGGGISFTNSRVDTRGDVTLRGGAFSAVTSTVLAPRIDLQANRVTLGAQRVIEGIAQPVLRATAIGDALIIRGLVDNVDRFSSLPGTGVLSTGPSGRWLLYARDPATTAPAGLNYGFKQYDTTYPAAAAQARGNGLLYAAQPLLGVAANGVPLSKVYDGSTTLALDEDQLGSLALTGFIGNDRPVSATGAIGSVAFASRNAGAAVPVLASLDDGLPTIRDGDRLVYGYGFSGQGLVGSITPAPLSVSAATVANKVYDGNTAATVNAWSLAGALPADAVTVATGSASFANAQAGMAKPVLATAGTLGGADAGNYLLAQPSVLASADIAQARLTYTAQPTVVVAGAPWPALQGTVSGFVPGESLASATSGSPSFQTPASAGSAPGAYPVLGGGLVAANYGLVQDPANASALRILPAGSREELPQRPLAPWWTTPNATPDTGQVTVLPPPTVLGFPPLDLDVLSPWRLGTELRARTLAMGRAFRVAAAALDADPALARLPACGGVAGALEGSCIVTPEIKTLLSSLWLAQPTWSGSLAARPRDELFELMFWPRTIDLDLALLTPAANYLTGTGSFTPHWTTLALGSTPPPSTPLAATRSIGAAGVASADASSTPPAVIVLASAKAELPLPFGAPAAIPGQGAPAAPVCTTPQQQLSGECQRHAELEGLREALQLCARLARDQQASCLFSERVKFRLQQREREARLISTALQTREARRAVLPDIRRKWALVIGVSHYPKVTLGGQPVRMPAAEHDARAIAQELRGGFGYITSELVDPTRAQVVQRLNMLAAIAQPQDSLLVFFSGYGFSVAQGEDAVWALADADPQDGRSVLSHADLARLLELIDSRQVALISDSTLAGRLRVKAVDYDPKAAPDATGLLGRRATVALTSGGNLPLGSVAGQGMSDFATQLLGVLRRVSTWHIGGRVFREVQAPLIQAGRPFVPQYGAASENLHQQRADYVFERRELQRDTPANP